MLSFTYTNLIAAAPCDSADKYWQKYGKPEVYYYGEIIERCSLSDFFWCCRLNKTAVVISAKLAIFAAKLIQQHNEDPRVVAAIEAAERCLAEPTEANRRQAARAADAAADAARASAARAARAAATEQIKAEARRLIAEADRE